MISILVDNIKSRVSAPIEIMEDLRNYFSVKKPGSFWAGRYNRGWDGLYYFITPKGLIATGMLPILIKFCESEYPGIPINLIDDRGSIPQFSSTFVDKVGEYHMTDNYIHQRRSIEKLNRYMRDLYFPRGIIDAATNAGKTTIAGGILLNLTGDNHMIMCIHSKPIFRQLSEELTTVFGSVGQINDKEYDIQPVTIAMINTLYSRIDSVNIKKDLSRFNVLIIDEVHRAGTKLYTEVLKHCHAPVRVGLSGTALDSTDPVSKLRVMGHTANRIDKISKRELMDKGISTEVEVHIHLCQTLLSKIVVDYRDIVKECIYQSVERSSIIWNNSKGEGKTTLVTVDKIEHGEAIYNNLNAMKTDEGSEVVIELTHGKDKQQEVKIEAFKNGEIDILISTAVLREGVSLPLVNNIFLAGGGKSTINVKQWSGRGERLMEGKDVVHFHDFYDIGNHIKKHSETRIRVYKKEDLKVTEHYDIEKAKKLKSILW